MFETDAVLLAGTRCDYRFESVLSSGLGPAANGSLAAILPRAGSSLASLTSRTNRGRFYSPQYPSTYPKAAQCAYTFAGLPTERVKLVFEHIRLQKSDLR